MNSPFVKGSTNLPPVTKICWSCLGHSQWFCLWYLYGQYFANYYHDFGTRKAEVLNSLIINTTAKANDTTDML